MEIKEFYAQSLGIVAPWEVVEIQFLKENQRVEVRVESQKDYQWLDPATGEITPIHDWRERRWRHLPTCEYETWIVAKVPRVKGPDGEKRTVEVPWAEPFGRFTIAMEILIIRALQNCQAVTRAASLVGVSRDQAEGVLSRAVKRGIARRKTEPLQLVGIDEKSIRKRHHYATILTDLVSGHIVEIVEGRTIEKTTEMLRSLGKTATESIEAVSMDMWPAYRHAVEKQLPEATIVYDRFHVQKYLNTGVDEVRRTEHKELKVEGDLSLKGTKFAWLKTHEDLRRKCLIEFRKLLTLDLKTATAWGLKETFRHFWNYRSVTWAMRFFYNWIDTVESSGLAPMIKAAQTLRNHASGILNYIHYPITNASAEGMNSVIQGIRTAARGLPRFSSFRNRLLFFFGGLSLYPNS